MVYTFYNLMFFIAHITEDLAYHRTFFLLCKKAEENQQTMYLLAKEGVDYSLYNEIGWRMILTYHYDHEIQYALENIMDDYRSFFDKTSITCCLQGR